MAINKNFVVKNGFEVSTDLILANSDTRKVGIASTNPEYSLDVRGGIGASDSYISGFSTVFEEFNVGLGGTVLTVLGVGNSVGIGTALPRYLLDIRSPVSTGQTALYVQGDVRVTGDLHVDDITFDDATVQDLTVTDTFKVAGLSTFNSNTFIDAGLNVVGLTTLGSFVDINDSVDISDNLNVVGLTTLVGYVDINNSLDVAVDLNVGGLTTIGGYVDINDSVDISDNLNVIGVTTLATVDINAGDIEVSNVDTTDLNVTGIATIATISVVGAALSNLIVSGITTLGSVQVNSGVITATSGIVTYYGDGNYLDLTNNPSTGIGIGTTGGLVGYGITFLDLKGAGVSSSFYNSNVGIATIFFEGGGSGTIGIGTQFPGSSANGDLFYNIDYGRIFVYYDEVVLGVGTDAFWVDAAPFNIGTLNLVDSITLAQGSAATPTLNFYSDVSTGLFSPGAGQQTFVSIGASILNINPSGINVTGIVTSTSITTGNITSSGIVTAQDFDALSDINYKENINTINGALLKVEQLRGVKFDWKESGTPSYGVIAQELEEVLPELVHGDNPKTVNYNGIIGVLIEAIKELKAEIEDLKNTK